MIPLDMTAAEVFSASCLFVVGVLAGTAIFCRNYHENWAQFVGLAGIAIWAFARVSQLTDMMTTRLPSQGMILHAALLLYAVGTAWKVWAHRPHDPAPPAAPPAPYKLEPGDLHRAAGGRGK